MNLLTSKKCELLSDYQRNIVNDCLSSKREFMLIVSYDDCTLHIVEYANINDLYDFLIVNYKKINYKLLTRLNDDYTLLIVNLLVDLIQKENTQVRVYRRCLLDIQDYINKYDNFVIQYFYENYLTKKYEYHSTRDLIEFIQIVHRDKPYITCVNKLLFDACTYVIQHDINLLDWGVNCE